MSYLETNGREIIVEASAPDPLVWTATFLTNTEVTRDTLTFVTSQLIGFAVSVGDCIDGLTNILSLFVWLIYTFLQGFSIKVVRRLKASGKDGDSATATLLEY